MQFLTHLFAEDVWPLIWLAALAELVLVIALVGTGRGKFIVWMGVVAAVGVLLFVVERLWVTDRERVDGTIDQMAQAIMQKDADGLVRHLSPRCRYGGLDRDGIRRMALALFQNTEFDRIKLSERKTEVFPLRKEAKAQFRAMASGKQSTIAFNSYPTRWVVTFAETADGVWQVTDVVQIQVSGDNATAPLHPGGLP